MSVDLGPDDVVLAAHPGSGASWIGTLLVQLGIFYVPGEDRVGGQLERLPTLRDRDQRATWREPLRVVKTSESALMQPPSGKVVLLVRDGRDALLSLYHHQRTFSGLDDPLLDFLTGNGGATLPPPMGWAIFCMSWLGRTPSDRLHVLGFEACKADPTTGFRALLEFLGIDRSEDELRAAIEASSYSAMRNAESAFLARSGAGDGAGRIMRRGLVGEWREVYDESMLQTFEGMPRRALARLGYPVDAIRDRHREERE